MSFVDRVYRGFHKNQNMRSKDSGPYIYFPLPNNITKSPVRSKEKKIIFESLLRYIPLKDREFFEVFWKGSNIYLIQAAKHWFV